MKSFGNIELVFAGMPAQLSAQLGRIDVGKGREELYGDQLPEGSGRGALWRRRSG